MLETVELGLDKLSKAEYKPIHDELVERLVVLQQEARASGVGLVVLFEGWNGAGKGSRISDLLYNLDARATSVHVTPDLDIEEARMFATHYEGVSGYYPLMQEFWQALGPRGDITFFDRGWYSKALQHMLYVEFGEAAEDLTSAKLKQGSGAAAVGDYLSSVESFERQLVDDGYVVVKFFLHVSKDAQCKRLTRLYDDPETRWRVSKKKLKSVENYKQSYKLYDRLLEGSDFSFSPWVLVNGEDKRRANLDIAATLIGALEVALGRTKDPAAEKAAERAQANSGGAFEQGDPRARSADEAQAVFAAAEREAEAASKLAPIVSRFEIASDIPHLDEVDHTLVLEEDEYRRLLKHEQKRLAALEQRMYLSRIPLVVMYEGWDAAGKGGAIKRVAQALDARAYTIFTSPAPTKPELAHPHLWRYWTRLPKAGHVGIYDRSWYGRVLVERVEGFASATEWSRAYDEINEFERELTKWGAILVKFWVDVCPDEQLARFEAREADPAKRWKITEEDWRNREKYPQYRAAVEDMFRLTSTRDAPWTVLESDDKRFARVKSLQVINEALTERLREK
ncbi:polyphosphate--AMP phosphotransferase [Raoultibacter phocaeensis]|uniref:polyphosphate--AMP phosphotransferase n=1 Tax=Raoultibacter phocaeensis TaxID=2479841 RepID=UPI00111B41B9|nr:polyphosphate--AMP phosphotransferase [Raoultibacter phocaeensis]